MRTHQWYRILHTQNINRRFKMSSLSDSPGRPIMEEDTPQGSPSMVPLNGNKCAQSIPASQETRRSEVMKKRLKSFGKKFLVFMISHVGLTCLVVGYSIMGGFIFMKLEATQEIKSRAVIGEIRQMYVKRLWDVTQDLNVLYEYNWTETADDILKEFQTDVYENVKNSGWDGSDSVTEEVKEWTYAGALLYSVTVITTIGYGNLTPRTDWGRVVTMLYALVGIPLTLLCLTNIGSFMAQLFRMFWRKVLCRVCLKNKAARKTSLNRKSQHESVDAPTGSDVVITTSDEEKPTSVLGYSSKTKQPVVRIPIIVCLLLLTGYICLGAMLFTLWEPKWNYLEGSYFCFITLSTIGFGDFVPGHSHASWHDQAKRVSCTLYLLFGLALISMCFDLMQSEVREICRSFLRAIGIARPRPVEV